MAAVEYHIVQYSQTQYAVRAPAGRRAAANGRLQAYAPPPLRCTLHRLQVHLRRRIALRHGFQGVQLGGGTRGHRVAVLQGPGEVPQLGLEMFLKALILGFVLFNPAPLAIPTLAAHMDVSACDCLFKW